MTAKEEHPKEPAKQPEKPKEGAGAAKQDDHPPAGYEEQMAKQELEDDADLKALKEKLKKLKET